MAPPPPAKEQWETAAVVLAVLAALYAVVRWPLWWTFQRLIGMALTKEIADLERTSALAKANADILTAIEATQVAQGVALREIPRMSGVMEEMTRTLDRLDGTIAKIGEHVQDHGQELGRVAGFIESGERRKRGRRHDDPPLTENHP